MSLPIEIVDRDGAVREAADEVAGDTRAAFFRKAAIGGGTVLGSSAIMGLLPQVAAARPSNRQDLRILNYALTLEHLETAFYEGAVAASTITGPARQFARLVAAHEATHVKVLEDAIEMWKGKPVARPTFDFMDTNTDPARFLPTSLLLENTGVHAYLGQAGNLKDKALLATAASIVTVEARHAAAVAMLLDSSPFNDSSANAITPSGAFDTGKRMKTILKAVGATGFVTS